MREFGLIGKTLKHSFSANYFNAKFLAEGIYGCNYQLFELENISELPKLITEHPNLRGFNITIPYKESILPYLDDMDDMVKEIGACNCVKIENGKLFGYNTDVVGFTNSILPLIEYQHHKALILGNGGAAKAVIYALEQMSIAFQVIARNPKNKTELAWRNLSEDIVKECKIIINATPIGMWPKEDAFPDIAYNALSQFHLAFDLIYNPEATQFLQKAAVQGAKTQNGLEMLELQAEAAWAIFGGF